LWECRVVVALAGGVIASLAHVDVVAELGEVVEVKRVAFACATAAVGLLAVGVGLAERRMPPVPIRQAAVRVIGIVAREGFVVGRQAVGDDDHEVLLAAVLYRRLVVAPAAAVVTGQAPEVAGDLVVGLGQRRIGGGGEIVDLPDDVRRGAAA